MTYIGDFPHAWKTGIDEIDDDHQHLFKLVNGYISGNSDFALDDDRFLDWFLAELRNHFEKEEQVMARHGYPATEAHTRHHREIFQELATLRRSSRLSPMGIALEYQKALIRDILVRDLPFKAFLDEGQIAS